MRIPVVLLCCLSLIAAAEDDSARDAAKDLHKAARKANDLWTCLQLEAWGAAQERSLKLSCLGSYDVTGDARLAFPHQIHQFWDQGETVVVISGRQCFRLAPDGRPLHLALKLPFGPNHSDLSADGRFLAITRMFTNKEQRQVVQIAIIDFDEEGRGRVYAKSLPLNPKPGWHYRWAGGMRVADDGSAAAVAVAHRPPEPEKGKKRGPDEHHSLTLRRATGKIAKIAKQRDIHAVGRNGAWLICRTSVAPANKLTLVRNAEEIRKLPDNCRTAYGRAIFAEGGTFKTFADDANPTTWQAPVPAGHGAGGIMTFGEQLAIDLGTTDSGGTADNGDFMGPAAGEPTQRRHGLVYDWQTWAADPETAPLYKIADTRLRKTVGHREATTVVDGDAIILRHLTPGGPVDQRLATTSARVTNIRNSHFHLGVQLQGGEWAVLDLQGAYRWQGPATDLWVHNGTTAIVAHGHGGQRRYQLIHLAVEPAERQVINLDLSPGDWRIDVDARMTRVVAKRYVERNLHEWRQLDPLTGTVTDRENVNQDNKLVRRAPGALRTGVHHRNRFARHHWESGRLLPIAADPLSLPPERTWDLRDALLIAGRTMILLDRYGEVLVEGRKAFTRLTGHPRARRFSANERSRNLYLATEPRRKTPAKLLTEIAGNLKETNPASGNGKPLSDNGWRLKDTWRQDFIFAIPGKARELRWRMDDFGFGIERPRGVSRKHLALITRSLVLTVTTSSADDLAKPVK